MSYPVFKWHGNEDQLYGVASFEVGGFVVSCEFPSFEAAHSVAMMLDYAYKAGRADGIDLANVTVKSALKALT